MIDQKMNFNSVSAAIDAIKEAGQQIEASMREMKKVSKMMGDGALIGDGGTAFQQAIDTKLLKRMGQLQAKMVELERDLNGAVDAIHKGVKTAKSRFI